MSLTTMDILNTILDEASELYQSRILPYNGDNLAQIGKAIMEDKNIKNEYIDALINKIALSNIVSKLYSNPLAKLKGAGVPLGQTIEEIFINPAVDHGYSKEGTLLLQSNPADGKVCYYTLNRKSTYPVTIYDADLIKGFTSEQEYMSLYNKVVASLYSGDNIDEFLLTKGLFGKTIDAGAMQIVEADSAQPKELIKNIQKFSDWFTFANTEYNGYNLVNETKSSSNPTGETPCITFCPTENQVLLLRSDMKTEINFEVLATIFNMDVVALKQMTIIIDSFPSDNYDIYAVLCDQDAIQVRDQIVQMESQRIGNAMATNYWLHHQQFLFLSMFGNAVAFGKPKVPVTGLTINGLATVVAGSTIALTITYAPTDASVKSVYWTSSDPTKATVNKAGVVTGIGAGSVTITATAKDGSGITQTKSITVTAS